MVKACDFVPREGAGLDDVTLARAGAILKRVRDGGEEELRKISAELGDMRQDGKLVIGRSELEEAELMLPADERAVLKRVAEQIRTFALAQRAALSDLDMAVISGRAGHEIVAVDAAGCYAPGGRFPLPSSVLMTAVTARAAGVKHVVVASPRPTRATLAAAAIAGADEVLAVGGAQAIGAMAFGIGVPRCDVIAGPGNRYVTAAKKLVAGEVRIDMLAGPSELTILADEHAHAGVIAADLLAQAEHDDDAVPILVTTSAELGARVEAELARQLATLPTSPTAGKALANGALVLARTMEEGAEVCNCIGPEHLEVMVRDEDRVRPLLRHYGAIFWGEVSAEVFGDYGVGPNHTLPTGGGARSSGGLSVFDFVRIRTWMRMERNEDLGQVIADSARLARVEGLEGHARAAESRGFVQSG
jgi:phosphoribosyl-ATP pyrophosphohydrolase/phosphoribosyl-AMP cyclohydrolase/histidinol dehydrogenase